MNGSVKGAVGTVGTAGRHGTARHGTGWPPGQMRADPWSERFVRRHQAKSDRYRCTARAASSPVARVNSGEAGFSAVFASDCTSMKIRLLLDVAGWIGMVSLISAYWLVSTGRLHGTSRIYQTLNVIGAGGLLANTFYYRAYPAAALNLTWLGIGLTTYVRVAVRARRAGRKTRARPGSA